MKKRFSLIELMVVVAIIAILASLLFPALGKARKMALSIQCVNNLTQCGIGLFQYGDDSNGHIVLNYGISVMTWAALLNQQTMKEYFYNPPYYKCMGGDYIRNREVMLCPDAAPYRWSAIHYTYGVPYSYADHPGNQYDDTATKPTSYSVSGGTEVMSHKLRAPSQFFMMGDTARVDNLQSWSMGFLDSSSNYLLQLRHAKRANILWADGHAGGTSVQQIRDDMPKTVGRGAVYSAAGTRIPL